MTASPPRPPSAAVQVLWAKSGQKSAHQPGAGSGWLPVLHHLLDVGACARAILGREPERTRAYLAGDFGTDVLTALRWTCALAALHDLGKASPAFQRKAPDLAARVWAELPEQDHREDTPHGLVTQKLLPGLLTARGWSPAVASGVAQALGCHHGFREATPRAPDRGTGPKWAAVHHELLALVLRGFGLEDAPPPPITTWSGEAFMRLAGLTSFADWIGSSFKLEAQPNPLAFSDPAAYVNAALKQANTALDDIGWTVRQPLALNLGSVDETFAYLPGFRARPLQTLLAEVLAVPDPRPALILIEAPMGEGKTEAALYSALQLQTAAGHRGMYFALPTQATGNAMYTRLREFLGVQARHRAVPVTLDLQLLHGGAALHRDYQADLKATAQTRPVSEQRLDIQPNTVLELAGSVQAAEWFSHRKRALLSEYGVGTVDQALLGVLGVSHQFVRLWGLGNRVVVLDEVHAYDTYTTELIHALCRWLRALESSVIIMSATLPAQTRRDLLHSWNVTPDTAPPYPRLTVARTGEAKPVSHHIPGPRRSVTLNLRPTDPEPQMLAQQAISLAEAGGTVTVIVNTVQRAQNVFQAVRAELGERFQSMHHGSKHPQRIGVHLYHARYPAGDRGEREERALRYLGKQPARYLKKGKEITEDVRPERFILIATQVAEQSLDFDTDVMISDLAPVDLLLQRAGRLHRHATNTGRRGAHEQATLYVAGLTDWPESALSEYQWKYIYAPSLMYRTWHALQHRAQMTLPDDLDGLVQMVYDPAFPTLSGLEASQQATLAGADKVLQHRRQNHATTGSLAHIGSPEHALDIVRQDQASDPDSEPVNDDMDPSHDAAVYGTRLGDPSLRIVPVHHLDGTVYLDEYGKQPAQPSTLHKGDWEAARAIFARSLQVSRYDLIHGIEGQMKDRHLTCGTEHHGWNVHPLLREAKPLVLVNGEATLGRTRIRLDRELGLTYERIE
ncbi:CRISPR-associated helicase Cas3' [Deinococcus sp.]|uniref:CRISPR-associated helicase Cas3' n=1 Tax=Deinococcus sp. TaxID=47478 RepID=UPI0025E6DC06|nr:CRISPR-associated helicase Cas3' [Deinococcus sp.]